VSPEPVTLNAQPKQLHEVILSHPPADIEAMRVEIAANKPAVEEFGPTYSKLSATSAQHAANFSVAFSRTMQTTEQLGRLFAMVAVAPPADRKSILVAHRSAGDGVTVVHAVGAQPAAAARALMQDFLMDSGNVHEQAASDVAEWFQMAGGVLIETGVTPPAPSAPHDGFFGDLWNDAKKAAGAVVQAVKTVADAVGNAAGDFVKGIGHAITAVANWTADQVKNFVHAVLSAGKAVADVIGGAVAAGYAVLKKIVQGILAVGRSFRDVLQALANFTVDAVASTIKALKELGTSLTNIVIVGKTFDVIKKFTDAIIRAGEAVGDVVAEAVRFGAALLNDTIKAMMELGQAAATILIAAVTHPGNLGTAVVNSLHALGHNISSLLDDVKARGAQFVQSVAEAAAHIATDLADLAAYAARAAVDVAKEIVGGVIAAGQTIGDLIVHLAQEGVGGISKIIQAAFDLGQSLIDVTRGLIGVTGNLLVQSVKAILALGKSLADFLRAAMSDTVELAERLIAAAVQAGQAAVSVLATALEQGTIVLQRAVHAVFGQLGPLGEAVDWIMQQAANVQQLAWNTVIQAIGAAGRGITEILDWTRRKSDQALSAAIASLDAAGAALTTIVGWARAAGDAVMQLAGKALFHAGRTVAEVLIWVDKDVLTGVGAFIKGMLAAGAAVADLAFWAASRAIEITKEVIGELIAAGATLAQLVADTLAHPGDALPNLMRAFLALGKTLKEVVQSALVQPSEDAARKALAALKQIGQSALDVLKAAFEIGGSAVMLAFALILEWFPGDYRPLSTEERAQAELVFGHAPQLDQVRIAVKSLPDDLIEAINGGRALTAMYVLNFPPGTKNPDLPTLIHELTHVWQGVQIGPLYMINALEAQLSKAGYNYGFVNGTNGGPGWENGQGGEQALNNAKGNFGAFNAEQQAMIIQHYYVRRYVKSPPLDFTAWQPYANLVHTA
jgi:hypothetical protein